jgi:NAD(P)-dependent dehydrogenase (short-subunit alcohol dehydrogenase family)
MHRMKDKVALVTGGAGKLGSAIAKRVIEEGGRVVIADIALDRATEVAQSLGDQAYAVQFDATDSGSIETMVGAAAAHWGQLDALVNNVGHTAVAQTIADTNVIDTSIEAWDMAFTVNVRSLFLATKFALPHLLARERSAVVNMGSVSGLGGDSIFVAYGASKAAVINFSRYVAVQYGRQGVRCNTICPGPVGARSEASIAASLAASYVPAPGQPEHIAALAVHLASDEAAYTNGAVIACDGGLDCGITPWRPAV